MTIVVTSCAIMTAPDGRHLLQLRDGNPGIRFPHQWTLFGGQLDPGEDARSCLRRELHEELGFDTDDLLLWKVWRWDNYIIHIFDVPIGVDISMLRLSEGAGMSLFRKEELLQMKLAFCVGDIYREYFKEKKV